MESQTSSPGNNPLKFDVDESPPWGLSSLLALQTVLLSVTGIILTPAIVLRGAAMPASMEAGVIFYALVISGITTILQAKKVWRFGSGYILLMGTSGAFIAVGISALESGGMSLLMTLIIASSLIQFIFANHLGLLRRLVTPLVGGATIMLIAVTVMPIVFSHFPVQALGDAGYEDPLVALVTLAGILGLTFFGVRSLRLWAPIIGIILGSIVSYCFGNLDLSSVAQSPWIGLPTLEWSGFDLSFSSHFWVLLPAFIIVTIVGAIETYGDAIAVQQISHRKSKPIDYRSVQGALYADGLGNLLSGILGTLPNTTYSTSISVVDMTGVAARRVGIICGIIMTMLAFFPKITALILAIPKPVVGSYLLILILLLFIHGVKMVASEGLGFENGIVIGMGFWLGTGFQQQAIFQAYIPSWLAPILNNGMTSGTLVTLLLVGLLNLRHGRKALLKTKFSIKELPGINQFITEFAKKNKWNSRSLGRIQLAVEEIILGLADMGQSPKNNLPAKFRIELRMIDDQVEIDMAISSMDENIELLIDAAKLSKQVPINQLSFKILGSLSDEIRHYQFHGLDFICLKIKI